MRAFSQWSVKNNLLLHTNKTKEMVIDRRRSRSPPLPVSMDGVDIEVVSSYRYLGGPSTPLPSIEMGRVGFASSAGCAHSMCAVTCCTFYRSVVERDLLYAAVCWGSSQMDQDRRPMDKLKKAS